MAVTFRPASGPIISHSAAALRRGRTRGHERPLAEIDWTGRPVTIMGLGRHGGGVAAARYLALRGARVTISDAADQVALADSIAQLSDVPIAAIKLGGHDEADFNTDFVVVNPAVRPDHSCLNTARKRGTRLTSETELFLASCKARVIGVTGTNGKSTTCSMLHAILSASGQRSWLGGNIGQSLLGELNEIGADDWVVLELSSFQLAHLSDEARMPEMAVMTNCTPNHLDWHASFAAYAAAKRRIFGKEGPARLAEPWPLESVPRLAVRGQHNRHNAACAAAAAAIAGASEATIVSALASFRGLDHRLRFVADVAGRRFYNDSKSTTGSSTMAALAALDGPVWLLAGGQAKGVSFDELARSIVAGARGAALFGSARESLRSAIAAVDAGFDLFVGERLADAVDWCWQQSQAGDTILLSPACASHDQFRDFSERGETFVALAADIAACHAWRSRPLVSPPIVR